MKVLVISDSHYEERLIAKAYDAEKPDTICFLGDGLSGFLEFRDYELPGNINTFVVTGNCDYDTGDGYLTSQVALINGIRFFMAHGHTLGVRRGLEDLCNNAYVNGCSYALYGHTHVQNVSRLGGVTAINPGALERGMYAVIEIKNGEISIEPKALPFLK